MFKQEGMEDFRKVAANTVAIKYKSGKPMLLRSDYPTSLLNQGVSIPMWDLMVKRVLDEPKIGGICISEDSEEGQEILNGTPTQSVTQEFLLGLGDKRLREFAELYGVKVNERNSTKSVALKVLSAIADGAKPKETPQAV